MEKKTRVLVVVEADINCEEKEYHTNDDGGDSNGTSSKTKRTETKYNNMQVEVWNKMFRRVVAYKEQHGNTIVPRIFKEDKQPTNKMCGKNAIKTDNPSLGIWVHTQRVTYNRDKLSEKRKKLLNSIDFVWSVKAG